jgi:CSLREA domain-containing protein
MFKRLILIVLIMLGASGPQVGTAAPADVSIVVNTEADEVINNGQCSLREAVMAANDDVAVDTCAAGEGADTIVLPAGTYRLNKAGVDGLRMSSSITLSGASAANTIIDANGDGRTAVLTQFNNLMVCDGADDSIRVFDERGVASGTLVAPPANGAINLPNALFVGYDNETLYVSDFIAGVKRFRLPSGAFSDTLVAPTGSYGTLALSDMLLVPGANEILVADYYAPTSPPGPGRVLKFDSQNGAFLGEFVTPGSGGLNTANSIALQGNFLFVTDSSDNTVLRYNKTTGAFVDVFVSASSGGLSTPRDLLFNGSTLYVVSEGTDQVLRYNRMAICM